MPRVLHHYQRALQRYCYLQSEVGSFSWPISARRHPRLPPLLTAYPYRYSTLSRTMAPQLDSYFKQYVDFNPPLDI